MRTLRKSPRAVITVLICRASSLVGAAIIMSMVMVMNDRDDDNNHHEYGDRDE